MSENTTAIYDGFAALDGGVNAQANRAVTSGANPNGIDRNQTAFAVNCSFRGGLGATHRPVYMRSELLFSDESVLGAFGPSGLWQGASVHEATESSLIVAIGGRQFKIAVENNFRVSEITIPGDANANNINYAWFLQAGPFTVIQDGEAKPLIFDGTSLRRAKDGEIKPGTCMAFAQGRIVYATYDQFRRVTRFRATDLIGNKPFPGSPGGTPQYNYQDSVLLESENTFLNEGGDFSSRTDMGEIRAMVVPRMLDTSLGQGPLQIMCDRGSLSFNAPIDRTQWKNVTYPIVTESQLDYGPLGSRTAVNVNGDIIYRSREGFHSFKLARADFQSWLNTPISMEVDEIIQGDPEALLFYGSGVLFDSRLLHTTMPRPTSGGIVHDGLVALDMNLIATLRKRDNPAWEGLWTGLSILEVLKGTFGDVERCFAFCRRTDGRIELWEILPSATDEIWDNGVTPIVWSFETPAYDFNSPQDIKRLMTAAVWTSDVRETVEYLIEWRPDQHPCYAPWHTWSDCAPIRQCKLPRCGVPRNLKPQYRPKVKLPMPPSVCNEVNGTLLTDGCELQFRVQVTGHAEIRKIIFAADPRPEPFFDGCPTVGRCLPLECCSPDPLEYSSAPYHESGSNDGYFQYPYILAASPPPDYPYPWFPTPPQPYFGPEPCPECAIVNPAPTPPAVVVPPTVTYPGLPPVSRLPLPGQPWGSCSNEFDGRWTEPIASLTLGAGWMLEPPAGLQDGTFEAWCDATWQQFSDYVVANGLTVTGAWIGVEWTGDQIGGGATNRWFPDPLFQIPDYFHAYGLGWIVVIHYCLA